jgi:hypothetical protein
MGHVATTAAWLGVIVGVGLLTWSVSVVSRANPGDNLPYWSNAERTPGRSIGLRAAGVALVVLGASLLSPALGYWAVAVVVAAFTPGVLLLIRHNRALSRRDEEPGRGAGSR